MIRRPGRSVTLRLTLLFALVSSCVLLSLGWVFGSIVDRHFEELDAELLSGKLDLVRDALAEVRTDADLKALPGRLDGALVGHHGLSVRIRAGNGEILYNSPEANLPPPAAESLAPAARAAPRRATGQDGAALRVMSSEVPLGLPAAPRVMVDLGTDLAHHNLFMGSFRQALWTAVALAAFVSGLLGWLVARQGLAPLRNISENAARITARRLNERLALESFPDELAEVARTLNEMLARLEKSFDRLSDFSSDLAHELRTPVSNMLTQTQVTLSKARAADEYRDVLASNAEELERLSRIIADMLFLAKAENELIVPNREKVNLRAEADNLLEYYEPLAEESAIRLAVDGQATATGDRLMLRRAMSNLLSNALRHTPRGGVVNIRIDTLSDGATRVAVENSGASIAEEHLPRLFDRFYRVDQSRRHDSEGAGLGLAITQSILRAHGGDATARSSDGRTVFELRLPA